MGDASDGAVKQECDAILMDDSLRALSDKDGKIVRTFCDIAAMRTAHIKACHEFDDKLADQQYVVMDENRSQKWKRVSGKNATIFAQAGGLAYAVMPGAKMQEHHGHIATVYPAEMEPSGSLKKDVPIVANVGKTNGKMRVSQAFPVKFGEPDYFCYQSNEFFF